MADADAQRDHAPVGNHHGAHREVVRRERRQHQTAARRGDHRSSGAERIGRRTRRGRDDQPVAVVRGHHLPVHIRLDGDHPRAVALHGEFVESQQRVGLPGEVAPDREHRPRLDGEPPSGDLPEEPVQPVARRAREKSQMPGVDAQHRHRRAAQPVHAFEQRAVASVADHDGPLGLLPDAAAVDPLRPGVDARQLPHRRDELLIDRIVEAEGAERVEQPAQLPGGAGNLRTGKKYDFHRRKFRKK